MTTIKDIFRDYGPEYIQHFGDHMPSDQRKVIAAIINCRSGHYGACIYQCPQCDKKYTVYRCCGNRHCPNCQHHKSRQWLQNQLDRQLPYHPHIHYVVPGGAFSKSDGRWHCSRIDFLLPVKAISKIFKAKFRDLMKACNLYEQISPDVWKQNWIVNCQAIPTSEHSIKYLAAYVFKVAISNTRIIKVENRRVFFKYRKHKSNRWRTMNLDVIEFIRRFLQHVLPTGFMKVRYYGFLHPAASVSLDKIAALIQLAFGFRIVTPKTQLKAPEPMICSGCGAKLLLRASLLPFKSVVADSG